MDRRGAFRAQGFTLIELLIVLAIIGALVALLLPAVQAAREAARRVTCAHRLKEMVLALHQFHESRGFLPPGAVSSSTSLMAQATRRQLSIPPGATHGWMPFLLPYMEQQNLADRYDWDHDWRASENAFARSAPIPGFQCPSSPGRTRIDIFNSAVFGAVQAAVTDYAVNNAIDDHLYTHNLIDEASAKASDGVMRPDELHTFADIRDGLSNTMLVGECAGRPARFVAGGKFLSGGRRSGAGWADRDNEFLTHGYIDTGLTRPGPCAVNCTNDNEIYAFHPGGAMCGFGDGSVHFIDTEIEIRVIARLITRAAREPAGF